MWRVCSINPLAQTRNSVHAPICIATSPVRSRDRRGSIAAPPLEACTRSARAARTAGASDTSSADVTAAANRTASTRASGSIGNTNMSIAMTSRGHVASMSAGTTRALTIVIARPTADAGTASTRLSIASCRATRHRPAPSDSRTAISRCRASARASSRLVTFAHATSRTRPNAATINANSASTGPSSGRRVARDSTRTAVGAESVPAGNR